MKNERSAPVDLISEISLLKKLMTGHQLCFCVYKLIDTLDRLLRWVDWAEMLLAYVAFDN